MLFYYNMSLKIYNGIKFKSRDLPEIISQLYAIKERVDILLKRYSMLDYTFKKEHVRSEYFTEDYRNDKNKIEKDFVDN